MLWSLVLACAVDPPPPARAPAPSALSQALERIQDGPPSVVPEEGEPPPTPPRAEQPPPPKEGACADATDARERQERSMEGMQAKVARLGDQANAAASEMSRCLYDSECAADGRRAESLKKELEEREESARQAARALGPMEAKLFDLDQAVRRACDTQRR